MPNLKELYNQLKDFLNLKSNYREGVIKWYDSLNYNTQISDDDLQSVHGAAKKRVFESIRKERVNSRFKKVTRWSVAAAIGFVLCGSIYWYSQIQLVEITNDQLAAINPARQHAIIVLENGQKINLDSLKNNQQVQFGETVITKDGDGKVSYTYLNAKRDQVTTNKIYVPNGSTYELTLSDGTHVTLNSGSSLVFPSAFGIGDRVVKLDGEGYFQVTKKQNKVNFIVEANSQRVKVLGTKFNVKSYATEVFEHTTLAEGSVEVTLNKYKQLLVPGQQATMEGGKLLVRKVDLDDVLSWTKGQFCFDGSNTSEVLDEIARWYDIDIKYERTTSHQYKGKIPRNLSLDRLIELLNYAELQAKAYVDKNNRVFLTII